MRLALVQLQPRLLAVATNLRAALARMDSTAADLYLLPELYPSGYTFAEPDEVAAVAEPATTGPSFTAFADFARRRGAYVAYGFAERGPHAFYNAANLIGPAGLLGTYRKLQLFDREKLFFAPGGVPAPVFDLPFGRVGLMICFDWFFPEIARSLALRGAELILHPANLVLPHCPQAMITRALENRVFAATCDRVGVEEHGGVRHAFIGSSQLVSPRGELLTRCSADREELTVVEIDLAAARSKRLNAHNDLFADRRPELYSGLSD